MNSKRWLRPSSVVADARAFEARVWRGVAWCGAIGLVVLAFASSTHLGLTWDEPLQLRYGNRILAWYRSGFRDASALTYATPLFEYGGLFEAPAQFVAWLLPFEDVATRHVLTSLTAALGVAATWKLASFVAGPRAGFIAALLLALTPVWTGHGFFNSKDIPFATAAAWALYATILLATGPRPVPWRSVELAGLATGAALGVRCGGVFLLAYAPLGLLARYWLDRRLVAFAADGGENLRRPDGARSASKTRGVLRSVLAVFVFVAAAWCVMLIAWPWAQIDPLRRPFEAMYDATHSGWGGEMLFRGTLVQAQAAPPDYLPTWFAVTLPETYIVGVCCAVGLALVAWRGRRDGVRAAWTAERRSHAIALGTLSFAAFGPVLAAIVLRPVLYDAQRHFLFVLPPFAALSGCAIATWLRSTRAPATLRATSAVLLVATCVVTVREMVTLHPYEYVYFNRFEGGLAGAAQRFETDYWGASYQEGLAWVVKNVQPARGKRLRVASCSCFHETRHYIEEIAHAAEKFEVVKDGRAADIFLVGTRRGCSTEGRLLHVVERDGVPLLAVIRRERPKTDRARL